MKIFNWEKNRTLYRYLKNGDLFCFKIADKLFGYGRIIAKNKLGATVGIFDLFTSKPQLSHLIIKMLEITQSYSKPF